MKIRDERTSDTFKVNKFCDLDYGQVFEVVEGECTYRKMHCNGAANAYDINSNCTLRIPDDIPCIPVNATLLIED